MIRHFVAAVIVATVAVPAAGGPIEDAIAGSWRKPADTARDQYRHPAQTLKFLGVKPGQTVVEVSPGGGWYTEILAPTLKGEGTFIGAIIDPGNCLDLSEAGCLDILRAAASEFFELTAAAGKAPPRNERGFRGDKDLVRRKLDCAVINFLHAVRRQTRQPAFNTVRCPFMEGGPLYQDAKITSRTHVQWCVREPKKSVIAYFRPRQR
jgi:hypothetical protein